MQYSQGDLHQHLSRDLTVAIIHPRRTFFTAPNNPPRFARGTVKMLKCPWLSYFHWTPPGVLIYLFIYFLFFFSVCVVFTFIAVTQVKDSLTVFATDGK